jgi:hypothetical protein
MTYLQEVLQDFADPPREYSVLPFWFWNDDLEEEELLRQIADFDAHGVYGFVIHPRVGLPRSIGWMSERMLHLMRVAVEEADRRKMQVILYDEGMYPSGSSCGQVVAENPLYACRCLVYEEVEASGEVTLATGTRLVAKVETQSGRCLAVIDRPSISYIRGLHYIGDGPEEDTPPAADLLNPEAMQCFIRLVYDRYAEYLGQWFGSTIIGIFTDEPALLGKSEEKSLWPGTTGIIEQVNRILGYDFTPHLPALWFADEPDAQRHRDNYKRAVNRRLEETYYTQLSEWCAVHGIALMGHPGAPDDIGAEKFFHIPGQDIVWRYIEPDSPTSLEGEQSTQAKCSSSAMLHHGRRRNSNECFGAYGHELTFQEMKWLVDWCFVRGVNMIVPHAFYYSVRGVRIDERPPDVGPNSAWWNGYGRFSAYCRRLSWLNTDGEHICNVAILGEADRLPWRAARACFEHQRDFNYVSVSDLHDIAQVDEEGIHIRGMRYEALIMDGNYSLDPDAKDSIEILRRAGRVVSYPEGPTSQDACCLVERLDIIAPRDLTLTTYQPALRYRHMRKDGTNFYLLFNEGGSTIQSKYRVGTAGERYWLDPFDALPLRAPEETLLLNPYQTRILCVAKA